MAVADPSIVDLCAAAGAIGLLALGSLAFAWRLQRQGPSCFARVEANGSSPLLGKQAQEMGYWCLQPLAQAAVRVGVSPNQLTALSLLLGAMSGGAAVAGHLGLAGALGAAAALCDVLDGMVARATGATSAGGALLDASVDRATEFLLLGGLALRLRGSAAGLSLVLLAVFGSFMVSYGSAKAEGLGVQAPRGAMRRAERATYLCAGLLLTPFAQWAAARAWLPVWFAGLPLFCCLAVVGGVATVSSVLRLQAIAAAAQKRAAAGSQLAQVLALPRESPAPSAAPSRVLAGPARR